MSRILFQVIILGLFVYVVCMAVMAARQMSKKPAEDAISDGYTYEYVTESYDFEAYKS